MRSYAATIGWFALGVCGTASPDAHAFLPDASDGITFVIGHKGSSNTIANVVANARSISVHQSKAKGEAKFEPKTELGKRLWARRMKIESNEPDSLRPASELLNELRKSRGLAE